MPAVSLSVARLIIAAPSSGFSPRRPDLHRLWREPCWHRQIRGSDTKNLEQRAHFGGIDQAAGGGADIRGLTRGGAFEQALAARREAKALQERPLSDRSPDRSGERRGGL